VSSTILQSSSYPLVGWGGMFWRRTRKLGKSTPQKCVWVIASTILPCLLHRPIYHFWAWSWPGILCLQPPHLIVYITGLDISVVFLFCIVPIAPAFLVMLVRWRLMTWTTRSSSRLERTGPVKRPIIWRAFVLFRCTLARWFPVTYVLSVISRCTGFGSGKMISRRRITVVLPFPSFSFGYSTFFDLS
jgi:hypothetical protein